MKKSETKKEMEARHARERDEALMNGDDLSKVYRRQIAEGGSGEPEKVKARPSAKDTKSYHNKFAKKNIPSGSMPGKKSDADRLLKARADKEEILAKKAKEAVLEYEPMLKRWQDIAHALKTRLMSVPGAVAVELSKISAPAQIERILEDQLRHALSDIAKEKFK